MPNDSVSSLASMVPSHAITELSKKTRTSQQPPMPPIPRPGRSKAARMPNCDSAGSNCQVDGSIGRVKQSKCRSLFTQKQRHACASEELLDFRQQDDDKLGEKGEISPRQRIVNVKRVRKIVQVFGEHPPLEFILRDDAWPSFCQHSSSSNVSARHSSPENERMPPHSKDRSKNITPNSSDDDHVTFTLAFRESKRLTAQSSSSFGVSYKDMPSSVPPTAPPMEERSACDVQVNVQSTCRKFWGFGSGYTTREVLDIADAIDKLRCLKAA
ncbi:hypothetical protein DFS33DRAFT_427859 [Desarmillaria ectypa]|nr:hypothetical protein DFS33DRAFT_427859 [Desarmillaria ectypa]